MQNPKMRAAIEAMGRQIGPEVLKRCMDLYREEQAALAQASLLFGVDLHYGADTRQCLDIYAPPVRSNHLAPILIWVHGGGYVRGEKSSPDHPFNAHVGRFAARSGFMGVVMNYRLAPQHAWPAGGKDVGAVVQWLKDHAAQYGGDATRIVLAGTSAGAVHVATFLQLRLFAEGVRGAVLLSGLYGITKPEGSDLLYYGANESHYEGRFPLKSLVESDVPLLVACAEFDPPRFQAETLGLLSHIRRTRGHMPRAYLASGHNHYTIGLHVGSSDTRLSDEFISFAREQCGVAALPTQELNRPTM